MARRDPISIRLVTKNGYDWSPRYPAIETDIALVHQHDCQPSDPKIIFLGGLFVLALLACRAPIATSKLSAAPSSLIAVLGEASAAKCRNNTHPRGFTCQIMIAAIRRLL
jgi:hypothetical protein